MCTMCYIKLYKGNTEVNNVKVCPTCKMTVKDEGECRFCHTSITYEPDVYSDREHYIFNKYLLLYLLKRHWFSLLCLITVLLRLIYTKPAFNADFFLILFFICGSVVTSFLQEKIILRIQWKYSERYATLIVTSGKYLSGTIGVLFSFIMW